MSGEADLLKALASPERRQILRRMRGVEMASPSELAKQTDRSLATVANDVRVLADVGAVGLVFTEPVRGTVRHFYRFSVWQPWAQELIDLEPPPAGCAAGT